MAIKAAYLFIGICMWGVLFVIVKHVQVPPKYKVGNCFQYAYNKTYVGKIVEVRNFRYKYTLIKPKISEGKFLKISYVDINSELVECL